MEKSFIGKHISRIENEKAADYQQPLNFNYVDFKLSKIRRIPLNRHIVRVKEIFSVRPASPIPVVTINITGPTNASNELI